MIRRFARRAFAVSAVMSLVACAGACVLWARSYSATDEFRWRRIGSLEMLRTRQGHAVLASYEHEGARAPADAYGLTYQRDIPAPPTWDMMSFMLLCHDPQRTTAHWQRGGFGWTELRRSGRLSSGIAVVPFWTLATAMGLLPLGWTTLRVGARFRRQRRDPGVCRACGYDLRATPERCPECGTEARTAWVSL